MKLYSPSQRFKFRTHFCSINPACGRVGLNCNKILHSLLIEEIFDVVVQYNKTFFLAHRSSRKLYIVQLLD